MIHAEEPASPSRRRIVVFRILAALTGLLFLAAVFTVAVVAVSRQIGGTDAAAQANWWTDYAEHVSLLGVAALIASTGRPGWRILAGRRPPRGSTSA